MRRVVVAFAVAALAVVPATVEAQVGLVARGGSLGVGGEMTVDFNRHIGFRGGVGTIPAHPTADMEDISFELEPPSTLANAGIDLYPLGGHFRLSGGMLMKHDFALTATPKGTTYEVNNTTYDVSQVGTLRAEAAYKSTAPYATLGWSGRGRGIGLSFDMGAAFLGEPAIHLTASGPIAQNPAFLANLHAEEQKEQADAGKYLKVLPILSLGLRIGI